MMHTTIDQLSRVGEVPRPPTAAPLWLKLSDVAASLGFSPDLLLTAIEAGQLPLRTAQFGIKGLYHVNAADMHAYRASLARGQR
jgi:hypothetical protein